jgi:hypothetical protein
MPEKRWRMRPRGSESGTASRCRHAQVWRGAAARRLSASPLSIVAIALVLAFCLVSGPGRAQDDRSGDFSITGQLVDTRGQPVASAEIVLSSADDGDEPLALVESQEDGTWALELAEAPQRPVTVVIQRPHFTTASFTLDGEDLAQLAANQTISLGDVELTRRVTAGFWVATIIFIAMLALIALERLHSTVAALVGLSAVFLVTFVGGQIRTDLYIFDFERALTYINWEVIFLLIGMMIVIAIIEHTGVFQWAAFQAYRLSGGHSWLLLLILMAITAVASALLDYFTTMLLMTPISLQIGLALGINPLALIIPEVLASNVGGISTLIGTPTNILIGTYAASVLPIS